jgi:hypothetical protein
MNSRDVVCPNVADKPRLEFPVKFFFFYVYWLGYDVVLNTEIDSV